MPTLLNCISKAKANGYNCDCKVIETGLYIKDAEDLYFPAQIVINECHHFNVASDPSENSIVYLVETMDGHKGILVNAYNGYADPVLSSFIRQVEKTSKNSTYTDR